jgi:hypothetical protein
MVWFEGGVNLPLQHVMVACVISQDSRKACPHPQIHAASVLVTTDINVYKQQAINMGYKMVTKIIK